MTTFFFSNKITVVIFEISEGGLNNEELYPVMLFVNNTKCTYLLYRWIIMIYHCIKSCDKDLEVLVYEIRNTCKQCKQADKWFHRSQKKK